MEKTKGSGTFGPKQVGMIIFTGALMLLSACFVGGQNNTVLPVISQMRGWDINLLNIVSGFASLLDGIGIIIFAGLSRKNAKVTAGVALVVMAICLVIYGRTESLGLFLVLMFIMGAASGCFSSTCAMTLTANWWPTKKGVVLGFSTIGVVLMQIVYVPVMPVLYAKIGVPNTQIVLAIITLIIALISFFIIKDTPEEAGTTPDGLEGVELEKAKEITKALHEYKSPFTLGKLAKDPSNWTQAIGTMIPLLVAMTFIASTIPILIAYGYAPEFASMVFAIGGILCIIGSVAFGFIDQKLGTKKAFIIYIFFMMLAIILAMFMRTSVICVWLAAMILFAANGSARNLIPSFVGTRYGRWDYPAAYAMIGTIAMLGGGLGIMLTGIFKNPIHMYIFDLIMLVISLVLTIVTKDSFIGKKDEGME